MGGDRLLHPSFQLAPHSHPQASPIMGPSAHRLSKVARVTCAPFTAVLGFSILLTVVFILYHPTRGPGDLQKLGWQSWASISPKPATDGDANPTMQNGNNGVPPGTDWWDVETPEPEIESSSLPLDIWDPLMPHDTGCTCTFFFSYIPPKILFYCMQ